MSETVLAPVRFGDQFEITTAGLTVKRRPTFEECEHLWDGLLTMERVVQIAIGDAMRLFDELWGERASQIVSDRLGWSLDTLRNYEWVAKNVSPSVRRFDKLTISHHQVVARIKNPSEQREWLAKAAEGDGEKPWPVARLKREIKQIDGDPPLMFGITVFCDDEADQQAGCRQLDNLGRRYKTFVSGAKEQQ